MQLMTDVRQLLLAYLVSNHLSTGQQSTNAISNYQQENNCANRDWKIANNVNHNWRLPPLATVYYIAHINIH